MLTNSKVAELKQFAASIRIETMEQIATLGFGHVGGMRVFFIRLAS